MSGEDELINQDDIEKLLNGKDADAGSGENAESVEQPPGSEATAGDQSLDQGDIEAMLNGNNAAPEQSAASSPAASAPAASAPAASSPATSAPAASAEPDDDKLLGQNDIEELLNKAGKSTPAAEQPVQAQSAPVSPQTSGAETVQPGDIEYLLNQAQEAIESITTGPAEPSPQGASQFKLETFTGVPASTETATLDLIRDVDLDLKIELGRTHMYLEDVLKLNKGSVVPLDKMAGDPVDIYVNGRLIARGEVLVMNDNFCVRVAELIAGEAAG